MKKIINFNNFLINEELRGLAMPTLILNDFLIEEAEILLNDFVSSGEYKFNLVKKYEIKKLDFFRSKDWPNFPIKNLSVKFFFNKFSDTEFSNKFRTASKKKNFTATGWCGNLESKSIDYPIDKRTDHTIHLSLGIGANINEKFAEVDHLMIELESTILHELNHAYEAYNRWISGYGQVSTDVTWGLDVNRSKIKTEIFKFWLNSVGFYLYWAETHEINAMVQEAWPYVKRMDVKDMIEKCPTWDACQQMLNFNAVEFRKSIDDLILSIYPDINPEFILNRLKNGFANWLDLERKNSSRRYEDMPSLTGDKVRSLSFDKFLAVIENRVKIKGEKLRRGILKLYSIKNENYKK